MLKTKFFILLDLSGDRQSYTTPPPEHVELSTTPTHYPQHSPETQRVLAGNRTSQSLQSIINPPPDETPHRRQTLPHPANPNIAPPPRAASREFGASAYDPRRPRTPSLDVLILQKVTKLCETQTITDARLKALDNKVDNYQKSGDLDFVEDRTDLPMNTLSQLEEFELLLEDSREMKKMVRINLNACNLSTYQRDVF